jgi:hypothetical protein
MNPFAALGTVAGTLTGNLPGVGAALGALVGPAAAATAGIVAVTAAFNGAIDAVQYADSLSDTAKRLHVTTDALQEYRYAIRIAGGDTKGADDALEKFSENLGKAQQGLAKPLRAFKALGLDPDDFKSTDAALKAVTKSMEGLSNAQKDAVISQFGLSGLKELIGGGADEMARLLGEAKSVGVVMDADLIARAGELNDEFETAKEVVGIQLKGVLVDLMPVIIKLIGFMAQFAMEAAKVVQAFTSIENKTEAGLQAEVATASTRIEALAKTRDKQGGVLDKMQELHLREAVQNLTDANMELSARREASAAAEAKNLAVTHELIKTGSAKVRKAKKETLSAAPTPVSPVGVNPMFEGPMGDTWRQIYGLREIEEAAKERENKPVDALKIDGDVVDSAAVLAEWQKAMDDAERSTQNSVYEGIRGGLEAGFKDGLPGVLKYLKDALFRNALDGLARGLTDAVTGGGNANLFASVFGVTKRRGYASGTTSAFGGWSVVGEHGPELARLSPGSQVMSNAALRNVAMGAQGPGPQTIVFDNRGAVIWEQAARTMMTYADRAAAGAGVGAVQVSRRATPTDLARQGGRSLGR